MIKESFSKNPSNIGPQAPTIRDMHVQLSCSCTPITAFHMYQYQLNGFPFHYWLGMLLQLLFLLPISSFCLFDLMHLIFIPFHRLIILLWRALAEEERLLSQLEFTPHWLLMEKPTCMFSIMELRVLKSQKWVLGAWRKLKSIRSWHLNWDCCFCITHDIYEINDNIICFYNMHHFKILSHSI